MAGQQGSRWLNTGFGPLDTGYPTRFTHYRFADDDNSGVSYGVNLIKPAAIVIDSDIAVFQMVKLNRQFLRFAPLGTRTKTSPTHVLDKIYTTTTAADTPGQPVDGAPYSNLIINDDFKAYLMFRPKDGIYVTMGRIDWIWHAKAEKNANGDWVLSQQTTQDPFLPPDAEESKAGVDDTEQQEWTTDTQDYSFVNGP